jgi:hypothetical protein
MHSARVFLHGIIDYAGLFPPASLDMATAVRDFVEYRASPEADILGRFIVPASRLDELASVARSELAVGEAPLRLSVTGTADVIATRAAVVDLNTRHQDDPVPVRAFCDAVEMPVKSIGEIEIAARTLLSGVSLYLEVPVTGDIDGLVTAIAGAGVAAKIRTGGVVATAIPSSRQILDFIQTCVDSNVPFKATAGLHHAIRGSYPLTYEPGSPTAIMHGYLNVFLAAAFCANGRSDIALPVLDETDALAFHFDDKGAWWRQSVVEWNVLDRVRDRVALSFGSCSFTEPVAEARELQLI